VSGRRAESLVCLLLVAAAAACVGFVAAYVAGGDTQLLGLSLGGAFLLTGAALVVAGTRIVPQEVAVEERHPVGHPDDEAATAQIVRSAGAGVTRRRLLAGAGAAAGAGIAGAVVVPLASLGPWVGDRSIASPWQAGVGLVDEHGAAVAADILDPGGFLTAFAAGADLDELGAAVIVIRLRPGELRLPAGRRGWAPLGLVAYSKVCTHAGCAVSMLRYPLFDAHVPGPALVCPCHYSTFDVTDGGTVLFGPAGRSLPQLPLEVRADGTLAAAGPLSADVGPSWLGTHAPGRSGGW
jgi:ubiquinol-cytochrome c reductase iron-sulfur subunit